MKNKLKSTIKIHNSHKIGAKRVFNKFLQLARQIEEKTVGENWNKFEKIVLFGILFNKIAKTHRN